MFRRRLDGVVTCVVMFCLLYGCAGCAWDGGDDDRTKTTAIRNSAQVTRVFDNALTPSIDALDPMYLGAANQWCWLDCFVCLVAFYRYWLAVVCY